MSSYKWVTRNRDYSDERNQGGFVETACGNNHPLFKKKEETTAGNAKVVEENPLTGVISDPLSMMAAEDSPGLSHDPLSLAVAAASSSSVVKTQVMDDSFEPWESKRGGILLKYTTNEKLSITSSFLDSTGKTSVVKSASTVGEQMKNRLEQLDDFEDGSVQEMLDLSQAEYIKKIEMLKTELTDAWNNEHRVKALKIAIQCAKLLADRSVIQFYPSKFVLVTDILDSFGKLVYNRIVEKSTYIPQGSSVPKRLPRDFTPDMVPASAKETCRNWFFKIASIRELVPRLYVETSILKCYSFLTTSEYEQALLRLTSMMRGVGDPLVAVYARCFLCRVGIMVAPEVHTHLMANFNDFMSTYKQLSGTTVQNLLAMQHVEFPTYLHLYTPALDWILQCIAYKAPEATLVKILELCQGEKNSSLLLNSIMSAFPPEYISSRARRFTELIREASDTGLPKHHLFRTMGVSVTLSAPPKDQQLSILQDVWKVVMKLKDPKEYIAAAEVWIEYPAKYFGKREVNAMLGDVLKHMTPDRVYESYFPQLQSILGKVLSHVKDFGVLFGMDKFLPFIDLFQKDTIKIEVCKGVMEAFVRNQQEPTSDAMILNAMMYIGKILHDSMTAMTFEDERKQISLLIVGFLSKVSFGRDFEQTLNFFVDARASFSNLDSVLQFLVHNVNMLIMRTREVVKGSHTRKTAGFVRSCIAYNFITIPSLSGLFETLHLYLVSGRVALVNQALTQADSFFKAAITLIPDIPAEIEIDGVRKDTEDMLVEFILTFISSLLLLPDHPEQGPLYTLKGLLNVVNEYTWSVKGDAAARIYTGAISLLAAYSQPKFLYVIPHVEANDTLYGASPKYIEVINNLIDSMIEQVLSYLKELVTTPGRQAKVALDLFDRIVMTADLSKGDVAMLAMNLWNLSRKAAVGDPRREKSRKWVASLANRGVYGPDQLLPQLK